MSKFFFKYINFKLSGLPIFILIFTLGLSVNASDKPIAEKGILNLSGFDFLEHGSIDVNGEWRFYWQDFIDPAEAISKFETNASYLPLKVPGHWTGKKLTEAEDAEVLPGKGYGSYVIKIENLTLTEKVKNDLFFSASFIITNFDAYLIKVTKDGSEVIKIASSGQIASSPENSIAQYLPVSKRLDALPSDFYILFHVSSFESNSAGIVGGVSISTSNALLKTKASNDRTNFAIIGILFVMAFYHFGLFLLRREDKPSLLFGFVCFFNGLRFIATGHYLEQFFSPDAYWVFELRYRLEFLTVYIPFACFIHFLQSVFGTFYKKLWDVIVKVTWVISIASTATLVLDTAIFTPVINIYQIWLLLSGFTSIALLVIAVFKRVEGALPSFLGFAFLFSCGIHDILVSEGFIESVFLIPLGLVVFIFAQSYMLSLKFASAYRTSEHLSRNLADEVEKQTVELREKSAKLEEQNAVIEKQMDYIKTDLKVAAGVMETMMPAKQLKTKNTDLDVLFIPADELAGDIYGQEYKNGRLMFWACDVTGHGVASSMVAGIVREGIKSYRDEHIFIPEPDPATTLKKISADVGKAVKGSHFATMCLAVYDEATKVMTLSSAAHLKPILCRDGKIIKGLPVVNGPLIGIEDPSLANRDYSNATFNLKDGDFFFIYTDGVNEASETALTAQFGIRAIKRLIQKHRDDKDINNIILNEVIKFQNKETFDDDITMMSLRVMN